MENISIKFNKEFKNINPENKNELLKFFMKAYYYNDELLKPYAGDINVYDDIEKELHNLYKPITEDPIALLKKDNIKKGLEESSQDKEALFLIEQIMVGLKGNIGVTKDVIDELIKYHTKYNHEFLTNLYMEELSNSVGNEVHIVGRHDNAPFIEEGKINKVDNCNFITIDNYEGDIPFVGFKHYIIQIKDKDGRVIYKNTDQLDVNRLIDPDDIQATKYRILGVKSNKKISH